MSVKQPKSYFHRGGDTPLLGETISEHILSVADRFSNREAVVCIPQQQRLTYAELTEQVDKVAKGLIAFGFGRGDRIGIWSTNNLQWILVQLATARIGAILVNINPAYRVNELEYALEQSHVQCLFCIPSFRKSDYLAMLTQLLPEVLSQPWISTTLSTSNIPLGRPGFLRRSS